MKTKIIPCPVCDGKGYTLLVNTTDQSCSTGSKTCPHCNGTGVREVEHTNADRIRAMSDEELAAFIGHNCLCDQIQNNEREWCEARAVCDNCLVDWLKMPVKDGEDDG